MEKIEQIEKVEVVPQGPRVGVRHLQVVLAFSLCAIGYAMRINMSVAVVSMTTANTTKNPDIPVYDWNNQSLILSSFYWGYFSLQVLAAYLGKKYGPKWFLVAIMTLNSGLCALTPLVADTMGSTGVMVIRLFQGISQGFIFPSVHTLLTYWAPKPERSRLSSFAYSGCLVGTAIGTPVTGLISASWSGWPLSFYVFAAVGLIWTSFWTMFGSNKPSQDRFITKEERFYIENSLGHEKEVHHKVPWKSILSSPPFLSIITICISVAYGNTFLLTETPTYLNKILGFDMTSNSFLSASPSIAAVAFTFIMGPISDYLINNHIFSRILTRKVFNTIGTIIPAASLVLLGYLPKSMTYLSVALLIFNGAVSAGYALGAQVNLLDLSPNHAGILMGIANGCGNIFSMVSPIVAEYVVTDQTDQSQWRIVFWSASILYIVTNILYCIWGTGDVQSWNEEGIEEEEGEDVKKQPLP